jgi:hypothetical protein
MSLRYTAALVFLLACGTPTEPGEPVTFTTIRDDWNSKILSQRTQVIRDQRTWEAVWPDVVAFTPVPPTPHIDFTRENVVVAAMGETPDTCWRAQVVSILRNEFSAHVAVEFQRPQPSCSCPAAIGHPVHAVRTATLPPAVSFSVQRRFTSMTCN